MRRAILLVVTHLLGSGHLVRIAAIGRALAARGHAVTLVSGGMPNRLVDTGGMRLVQLPPVRAEVGDFSTLWDESGAPATTDRMAARRDILLDAVREARPEVVVLELYPFGRRGLAAEFEALIGAAETARPRPILACSIRDILVTPEKPEKIEAAHAVLTRAIDAILVHGDPALIPLDASWPLPASLRNRVAYTGYVGPEDTPTQRRLGSSPTAPPRPILVSGGASAASLPLYRAALGAAALGASARDGRPWHVLVGGSVDEATFRSLSDAAPPNVRVERARADFRDLMRKSDVFVGQAGYNTVMDIVATQARSVLVPFEAGRETEQRQRADALAARGLVHMLPEAELDPDRLAGAVEAARTRGRPDVAGIGLDGAVRSAEILEALAERSRPRVRVA